MTHIERLVKIVHPASSREKALAMLTAYCDESGHPSDTSVLTLAAVIAPAKEWERFEGKWKRILRRYHVSMFHMAKYESRYGEFAGWDEDRRISFIADLSAILKNTMLYGIADSLVVQDWDKTILPLFPRMRYSAPYLMLFQELILGITENAKYPDGETIACVFDDNHVIRHPATLFYECIRKAYGIEDILTSITFTNKKHIVPLQAADLVAYEAFKYASHWDEHGLGKPRRRLLNNISATNCITIGRYTRSDLEAFSEKSKIFLKYIENEGFQAGTQRYLTHLDDDYS